jgi:hypothetical protein
MGQALTLVHIRPICEYWYGLVWFGFTLFADTLMLRREGRSLVKNRLPDLALMTALSALAWWGFEGLNAALLNNWGYSASPDVPMWAQRLRSTVFFSSLIPATWTAILLTLSLPWAKRPSAHRSISPSRPWLALLGLFGAALAALALLVPFLALPLLLAAIVLILDPINYARRRPSLLGCIERGDARLPIAIFAGSLAAGLLGEFWNYWAVPKWTYSVPYIDFAYIFEMPLLGYLGYPMLAFAIFVLYHFVRGFVFAPASGASGDDTLATTGL